MSAIYHEGHRRLQDRFDTRRLADRLDERIVHDRLTDQDREFIRRLDMFFLATADAGGHPNCSYKGGDPGFVRVLDERTLAFPSWDGNGMYLSLGNLAANPHIGLLFIDFEKQRRLRLNGVASIDERDPLLDEYPGAQLVVRVSVREVFPNCPRYIHKLQPVERSAFVPRAGCTPPAPTGRRAIWRGTSCPRTIPRGRRDRRAPRKLTTPAAG
jgi:predicted pyridoxine 5'-phosphate oxidase superfamily flavin-nucleotide-binding protein